MTRPEPQAHYEEWARRVFDLHRAYRTSDALALDRAFASEVDPDLAEAGAYLDALLAEFRVYLDEQLNPPERTGQ